MCTSMIGPRLAVSAPPAALQEPASPRARVPCKKLRRFMREVYGQILSTCPSPTASYMSVHIRQDTKTMKNKIFHIALCSVFALAGACGKQPAAPKVAHVKVPFTGLNPAPAEIIGAT